jgi:hypothetical protein
MRKRCHALQATTIFFILIKQNQQNFIRCFISCKPPTFFVPRNTDDLERYKNLKITNQVLLCFCYGNCNFTWDIFLLMAKEFPELTNLWCFSVS